uniref:Uncharacterized protein n=1 Tax=Ixodes scapularis TaxID=6945 RepID=A0A4D5RAE0_IXOSC
MGSARRPSRSSTSTWRARPRTMACCASWPASRTSPRARRAPWWPRSSRPWRPTRRTSRGTSSTRPSWRRTRCGTSWMWSSRTPVSRS